MRKDLLINLRSLKGLEEFNPSPTFKQNAKNRLIARVSLEQSITAVHKPKAASRLIYPFVFAALLLFCTSGTVFAAQSSNPGEFLYPVKIASEKALLTITSPVPMLNSQAEELVEKRRSEEAALEKKRDFDKNRIMPNKENKTQPEKKQAPEKVQEQNKKPTKGQVKSKSTEQDAKNTETNKNTKPSNGKSQNKDNNSGSEKSNSKSKN